MIAKLSVARDRDSYQIVPGDVFSHHEPSLARRQLGNSHPGSNMSLAENALVIRTVSIHMVRTSKTP